MATHSSILAWRIPWTEEPGRLQSFFFSFLSFFLFFFFTELLRFVCCCCCCCSVAKSGPILCDPMDYSTPGFLVLHYLSGFVQTHVHWVDEVIWHLILCLPLLLLPSTFPSIRMFSNESPVHIMWPKYWSFSFSTSPSNEYPGFISFRIDWFDLLALLELQSTLNGQSNLEKKIQKKKKKTLWYQTDWLQTILQSYSNQNSMILAQKHISGTE